MPGPNFSPLKKEYLSVKRGQEVPILAGKSEMNKRRYAAFSFLAVFMIASTWISTRRHLKKIAAKGDVALFCAATVWMDKSFEFESAYIERVKNVFAVEPQPVDSLRADFTAIHRPRDDYDNLFIQKAIQIAYVNVDENGTEATAVDLVAFGVGFGDEPPPSPVFRADHPFLFFIRDKATGAVLFMGKVTNPSGG
jgi:serine protease inhibitor